MMPIRLRLGHWLFGRGLCVNMHPEKLDVESVQVRNMRNEVDEVRKLENVSIQHLNAIKKKETYLNPEYVFHFEVLGSCRAILLHDLSHGAS